MAIILQLQLMKQDKDTKLLLVQNQRSSPFIFKNLSFLGRDMRGRSRYYARKLSELKPKKKRGKMEGLCLIPLKSPSVPWECGLGNLEWRIDIIGARTFFCSSGLNPCKLLLNFGWFCKIAGKCVGGFCFFLLF